MKMICPLFSSSHRWNECKQEECAWWSKSFEMCDVNILAQTLWELKEVLKSIEAKMPYGQPFVK